MRNLLLAAGAGLLLSACATSGPTRWTYGGQSFATYEECRAARERARNRTAVAGAVGGAVTGAALGGNVGETALAAGLGAAGGAALGGRSRRC
ncbi:MAG: hypothetical protein SNJ63_03265 [Sphingomonadaceae bacterium]